MNEEIRLAHENNASDNLAYTGFMKDLVPSAQRPVKESAEIPLLRHIPAEMMDLFDDDFWVGLARIFSRPWWHRVWVMQEATATHAEDVIVLFGDEKAPFSTYLDCDQALLDAETMGVWTGRAQPDTGVDITRQFVQLRQAGESLDRFSLDTLDSIRGQGATDPRDIVYAGMNMTSGDLEEEGLHLDYSMSVFEFYGAVAAHFLKDEQEPLKILSHCGSDTDALEPGWPSWIPDWRLGPYVNRFDKKGLDAKRQHFTLYDPCRSDTTSSLPHDTRPIAQGNELLVHGIVIETITRLSSPCSTPHIEEAAEVIAAWIPANGTDSYITGETRLRAFQRTIVADIAMEENPRRGGLGELELDETTMSREDVFDRRYHLYRYIQWRRLACSVKGYMALVDEEVQEGDCLCALYGVSILYVLRPKEEGFGFVGECYVHGFMDGRAVGQAEKGEAEEKTFRII